MPANPASDKRPPSQLLAGPIDVPHVDEGVDRVNFKKISQRYQQLNKHRHDRLRAALNTQQQLFLDLLPLALHLNHPVLPGYAGADTPSGISQFRPSRESIKSARNFARSFVLPREPRADAAINAVYAMGSCGSLAQGRRSDLDIWVCVSKTLDIAAHKRLETKCELLQAWAANLRLETHFFIMDEDQFRAEQRNIMDEENCGITQRFLLLDEFYRTGILLAGNMPMWWMVPDRFEGDYTRFTATLTEKRFVNPDHFIDFGPASDIPRNEFISAGVWQLYKSLASPYKALLKLLLIEVYASEFPSTQCTSNQLKALLYNGVDDLDDLDPYILIYQKIENYLVGRDELERLELVRRSFYFKAGIQLSVAPAETIPGELAERHSHLDWRRNAMRKLVEKWGWSQSLLARLDQQPRWPIAHIQAEQNRLTRELTHSYRLLSGLLRSTETGQEDEHGLQLDSRDLTLLGRQLYAAFERKAHKLNRLQFGIVKSLVQPVITLSYDANANSKSAWSVHSGLYSRAAQEATDNNGDNIDDSVISRQAAAMRKAANPVELISWCVLNKVIDSTTRMHVDNDCQDLSEYEVRQLQSALIQSLANVADRPLRILGNECFAKPATTQHCTFVVNAGIDPMRLQKDQGIQRISEKTDPLAYSGMQENLVHSIQLLASNNWGEVYCYEFTGENALDDCIIHYLNYVNTETGTLPSKKIICACPSRAMAIVERLENLFEDIVEYFFANKKVPGGSYIYETAQGIHRLFWENDEPGVTRYTSQDAFLEALKDPDMASSIQIDRFALQAHPLHTIVRTSDAAKASIQARQPRKSTENSIRVFYEVRDRSVDIYLVDGEQRISVQTTEFESTRSLILPLSRFIQSGLLRHSAVNNSPGFGKPTLEAVTSTDIPDIEFYLLSTSGNGYTTRRVPTESDISARYLPIKAIGTQSGLHPIEWSICCEEVMYDQAELGDQVFVAVARAIQQHRQAGQPRYRCYITDIDISACSGNGTSLAHELYYKLLLEEKLNNAFSELEK